MDKSKTVDPSWQGQPAVGNSALDSYSNEKINDSTQFPVPVSQFFTVQQGAPPPVVASDDASDTGEDGLLRDETYPEGGLEAWSVVFGAWCGLLGSLGLMNTIATLQTYVISHQLANYNAGTVGWIFSVFTANAFFCGVYIGPMFDKYGPRWLLLAGTLCVTGGLMITSVCTEYWHFILSFSILTGLGVALLFTPSVAAIGHFFYERRGFASGVASTAGGVGGIAFPLILTRFFDHLGWAWSLRITGFICLFILIFAITLVKRRLPPAKNASTHPDFSILKERTFLLFTIGMFMMEFGLFIPLAYLSSYALAQGFDSQFATGTIIAAFNAGSVLGRVLPGYLADIFGPYNSNVGSLVISIFACFVVWLPFGHTMAGLITFAVLFGFSTGNNISVTPVCIGRLCHTQQYGRYYATCYTVISVACLIGIPIGGSIVTATGGDYWGLILCTGLSQAAAFIFIYSARASKVGWNPLIKF